MDALFSVLKTIGLILVVIGFFNIAIFIHELGHFLAARWRGLYVDRFQVWFGKPIWKKEINGVSYGLGWLPAGGFVSLPQMAPMQSVEGEATTEQPLPPVNPIDKIIVAAAGPIFSFLLAIAFALVVWSVGKPTDLLETTTIGHVQKDSPAEKAGLLPGDDILEIDGEPVIAWTGNFDSVVEKIIFTDHTTISFKVRREGVAEPLTLNSEFEIPDSAWWERSGMRRVGISHASSSTIGAVMPASPALKAGLQPGDEVITIDGHPVKSPAFISEVITAAGTSQVTLGILRGAETLNIPTTPEVPKINGEVPMIGVGWARDDLFNTSLTYPNPVEQVKDTLYRMYITITKVISPGSSIGIQHMSGPIGIAKAKYDLLKTDDGLRRLLWFAAFFNINLGIINLLPFPVLDGGHIVLATLEKIKGSPIKAKLLEYVQTAFAILIFSVFLYITSKDIPMLRPDEVRQEISFE